MADQPRSPDHTNGRQRSDQVPPSGRRPWVVVVWIVLAIVLLGLIVFLHVSGAIGPGIH